MLHGEVPACALDKGVRVTGLHELEAITERASLADKSMDFDLALRQSECETHDCADGDLIPQHCRQSRFADVDRMSADYVRVARINLYVHFHPESRMPASFGEFAICHCFQV